MLSSDSRRVLCWILKWQRSDAAKPYSRHYFILGLRGAEKLLGDDVAGEVVEHGGQINPTPANDVEVGEVCLPDLVGVGSLSIRSAQGTNHDISYSGSEVLGIEQAVNLSL